MAARPGAQAARAEGVGRAGAPTRVPGRGCPAAPGKNPRAEQSGAGALGMPAGREGDFGHRWRGGGICPRGCAHCRGETQPGLQRKFSVFLPLFVSFFFLFFFSCLFGVYHALKKKSKLQRKKKIICKPQLPARGSFPTEPGAGLGSGRDARAGPGSGNGGDAHPSLSRDPRDQSATFPDLHNDVLVTAWGELPRAQTSPSGAGSPQDWFFWKLRAEGRARCRQR